MVTKKLEQISRLLGVAMVHSPRIVEGKSQHWSSSECLCGLFLEALSVKGKCNKACNVILLAKWNSMSEILSPHTTAIFNLLKKK